MRREDLNTTSIIFQRLQAQESLNELARMQVLVADLRIEGRSLDNAYVALTGRTMDT